ncbi:hypothetical protein [Acinetobacter wuhouensis]|uniref:Uncharacterized protein n=1 Tax=Acinetobacter wuhouensis TaxID=1879050 RepID=A0A3G2SYB3_9GAMM|nr:hypothetical protein [Acinetobacter wuhouensis]AYO52869.1 hypothetical protein CDG68_03890 [Acinetobacter wuhouensis]
MKMMYPLVLLLSTTNLFAKPNDIDTFFKKFPHNHHNLINIPRKGESKWTYTCKINAEWGKKIENNIRDVNFDSKNRTIQFSFDAPDRPFYKLTSVKKIGKDYRVYFQDKIQGTDFWFDVALKQKNVSSWDYHSKFEDDENFRDQSFDMISFDKQPDIKIVNECKK